MTIEESVAVGVVKLYELGAVVVILTIAIIALGWFVKYLLNKTEKLQESLLNVQIETVKILTELKEVIRDASRR